MATYNDLLLEIQDEAKDFALNARIPLLVKEVERYLWNELPGMLEVEDLTIGSGNSSEVVDSSLWKKVERVYRVDDGVGVERVGEVRYQELVLNGNSGYTTIDYFCMGRFGSSSEFKVYGTPDEDVDLKIVVWKREDYIGVDSEETAFFLNEGFALLKYGVLALRVPKADMREFWLSEYYRELKNVRGMMMRQKVTNVTSNRRFF